MLIQQIVQSNGMGQIGIGLPQTTTYVGAVNGYIGDALPAIQLGTGLQVLSVAAGSQNSCALLTGNKVKCFGGNGYGQLGLGSTTAYGTSLSQMGDNLPFADLGTNVEVASLYTASGASFNCVILSAPASSAQRFKCWGYNYDYALGYGDSNHRGDALTEVGDNLPLVDLGTESKVKTLALGTSHVCALLISDGLKCWGQGIYAQLGSGSSATVSSIGDSLPFIQIDTARTVKYLSAGQWHTCIVYDDQTTMKCVGYNSFGSLGQGDTTKRGDSLPTTYPYIPAIQLGTGSLQIASIHCALYHTCIIFIDYSMKCFGTNANGQFAIGSKLDIGDNPNEMGSYLQFSQALGAPTSTPTNAPSRVPTFSPTSTPSSTPTTKSPTNTPSTSTPSRAPTMNPTLIPTKTPTTQSPTKAPSYTPSSVPTTMAPTNNPIVIPTNAPTNNPTYKPSAVPITTPTKTPGNAPTLPPSSNPSSAPINIPSSNPTTTPTKSPSIASTIEPTTSTPTTSTPTTTTASNDTNANNTSMAIGLGISIPLIAISAAFGFFFFRVQNRKSSTVNNEMVPSHTVSP